MRPAELVHVPSVAESALTSAFAEQLPASAPAGPWECQAEAVVWLGRGGAVAHQALAPELRAARSALGVLGVLGGMVRYSQTPVGPYNEVFGGLAFRDRATVRGSVAFMAVDSQVSLVGGRSNWSMPKTIAEFDGHPLAHMSAKGTGWHVGTQTKPLGPIMPLRSAATVVQQWPDAQVGAATMQVRGRARLAVVSVGVEGVDAVPTLSGWLRPGRHLGLVLPQMSFRLEPTRVR